MYFASCTFRPKRYFPLNSYVTQAFLEAREGKIKFQNLKCLQSHCQLLLMLLFSVSKSIGIFIFDFEIALLSRCGKYIGKKFGRRSVPSLSLFKVFWKFKSINKAVQRGRQPGQLTREPWLGGALRREGCPLWSIFSLWFGLFLLYLSWEGRCKYFLP